ncbi:MAG: PLP-dependent transferase [Acidobacteriota bacterium]|nr:PLP-dependent transferase [Acidobacteriota bacterium]
MRNLLVSPAWREADLGRSLPDSPHATSTAMPLWSHVIGYEEGDEAVTGKLQCGYPRFFRHPFVTELLEVCGLPASRSLPFPSEKTARRALAFVKARSGKKGELTDTGRCGIWAVTVPPETYGELWAYWQHTGEIVSSRQARAAIEDRQPLDGNRVRAELARKPAALAKVGKEDVRLYPTGMAAVTGAFRAVRTLKPDRPTVQFGFPYVDTLKLQQKMGAGVLFLHKGDAADLAELAAKLDELQPAAVFCECPANPLLQLPDLAALSALLRPGRIPLVVDNTIDSFHRMKVLPHADLVVTSLTKYFSSAGDVMGGSLIINPDSPFTKPLREALAADFEPLLFAEDASILSANAEDFTKRMRQVEANAADLIAFLKAHDRIARVWDCGFGGLFSFEPVNAEETAPNFYDRLRCSKGPSLGTDFTLVCPYTMLAHYDELDWAEQCGISPYLIRVSVGLEPSDDLIARFDEALQG